LHDTALDFRYLSICLWYAGSFLRSAEWDGVVLYVGVSVDAVCLNGGTCRDLGDSHRCECRRGFDGSRCQRDIDECRSQPCRNGARCVDLVGRYHCDCPLGFQVRTILSQSFTQSEIKPKQNTKTARNSFRLVSASLAYLFIRMSETNSYLLKSGALMLRVIVRFTSHYNTSLFSVTSQWYL